MRARRLVLFILAIAAGIAGGIAYGWMANPVKYVDTPLYTLRNDYKADYVLMVAEAYQTERDLEVAVRDLELLQDDPMRLVQQAVVIGQDLGYSNQDIEVLGELLQELQSLTPDSEAKP
jgi:hypothetical protein